MLNPCYHIIQKLSHYIFIQILNFMRICISNQMKLKDSDYKKKILPFSRQCGTWFLNFEACSRIIHMPDKWFLYQNLHIWSTIIHFWTYFWSNICQYAQLRIIIRKNLKFLFQRYPKQRQWGFEYNFCLHYHNDMAFQDYPSSIFCLN